MKKNAAVGSKGASKTLWTSGGSTPMFKQQIRALPIVCVRRFPAALKSAASRSRSR